MNRSFNMKLHESLNVVGSRLHPFGGARKSGIVAGLAISAAVLFAGCGGGTDTSSDSSGSDSTSATTTTGTTAGTTTNGPAPTIKSTPDTTTTTNSGTTPTVVKTPTTNTVTTGNGTVSTTAVTNTSLTGGAAIFNQYCGQCHKLGSVGHGKIALDHIGKEKDQTWIEVQIRNPKKHGADSRMPPFPASKLSDADLHTVAKYLASMK